MKYFAASQMVQPNYVRKKIRTRSRHRTRYRLEAGLDLPLPRISIPRVNLPSLKKSGHFELALKIDGKAKKEVSTNDQDTTATPDTSKTPASETPVENPTETPVETPTETPEDKTPAADAEQPTLKKTEPGDKTPDDQKPVEQETVQKDQGNTDEKTETPVETPAETPAENPAEKTDDKPEDKKPAGEAEKKDSTDTNADVKSTETEWISPIENADCNLDDRRFGCYQDPKAMKKNGKLVAKFRLHKGWDLKTSRQSKAVVAPTDCKIEKVVHNTSPTSYGNQMFLLCEGYQVIFSHLKSFIKTSGDVKRGEKIANSGQTGYTTGYNLEIGLKKDGKLVDPSTKFKESSICKSADPIDPTFEKQPASTCSSGAKDGSGESTEENTKVQTPVEQDSEKLISTSKAAS